MDYARNHLFTLISLLSWRASTCECLSSKLVCLVAHSLSQPHLKNKFCCSNSQSISNVLSSVSVIGETCCLLPFERNTSHRVPLLVSLRVCLCMHVCVIIMSWSEAIWVGWLICICGVNRYKYSWPGSKLVWIFISPPGRRRVEWLWFQSAEQKLTQPFFCGGRGTLDDCRGPLLVCLASSICIWIISFALVIWWPCLMYIVVGETLPRKTERQMEASANSTCPGTKTVWDDAITLQNGQEAAVQRIQQSPIKKLQRQDWEASWWCQPTSDVAVQPTQPNVFFSTDDRVLVSLLAKIPWSSWLRATFDTSMETVTVAVVLQSSSFLCGWRGSVFDVVTLFSHNFGSVAFAEVWNHEPDDCDEKSVRK